MERANEGLEIQDHGTDMRRGSRSSRDLCTAQNLRITIGQKKERMDVGGGDTAVCIPRSFETHLGWGAVGALPWLGWGLPPYCGVAIWGSRYLTLRGSS
jgi:hypothetical protein